MKLSGAEIGQKVMMVEHMGDEVRQTSYERREPDEGEPILPHHVAAWRTRTVQGAYGDKPRYSTGFHRSRTQVDGRITVEPERGWPIVSVAATADMTPGFRNQLDDFGL